MKRLNDIFKVLLLLSLTSFFVNCTIEDIDDVKSALPYLVIETDSISFDNVNTYIEIPIKTNRELTIETSYIDSSGVDPWLEASLSANSDTLRISVAEYNQDIRRRAILTLSSRNDLVDHKITVSQKGSFIPDWKPIDGVYNLSQNGTANCYIVPKSGEYAFYALTKGNSTLPVGDVAAVEALWETVGMTPTSYLITHYSLDDDGYVRFTANGIEGNVLISVKDVSGTILWSWHIWITDQPENHYYTNGASGYYVMDRNLGAIRPNGGTGDQWIESVGTHYQRGRKDPFIMGAYTLASSPYTTVEQSVANPTEFSSRTSNSWLEPWDYSLWSPTGKTMYDPCPVGYRVATKDVYACLKSPKVSTHGVEFCYDGSNTAWYPCTPHTDCYGNYMNDNGNYAYMWVSNATSSSYEVDAIYYDLSSWSSGNIMNSTRSNGDTYPVRCMKDDGSSIPPAPEPEPEPEPEPSFSDWYLTGDFNAWGLNDQDRMRDEGEFYVYRNLTLDTDGWICIVRGMWEETVGNDGEFYSDTAMDVRSGGSSIAVPAGTYDVYLSSDLSKLYFMTDGKTPDQAAPAPDPNPSPSPSVDWTSDEVISYDLPEHASSHRQVLKNIKYLHDDENFYVKLQASAALFKESGTNYLSVFIFDDTNGSGIGYYGWWNNAGGNIEYFGEHVGVFTGTDLTLTIGSTPIPVEKEEYGDSLIWTLSIPRSAQSPLETRNPSFAFMTMCDWDPTGALPDKYDDMLKFYPSGAPDPEPAPVETTYTVVGDIEGYSWDYSSPVGLMTKEDKFYVAKNIPFKSIQFKIVKTGGWDVVYGVKEDKAYGLNTEIPVSINHSYNICVQAPEERKYDVYFDLDNEKVWFMEPGKRPGDDITSEKPGGTEGLPDEGYEWE